MSLPSLDTTMPNLRPQSNYLEARRKKQLDLKETEMKKTSPKYQCPAVVPESIDFYLDFENFSTWDAYDYNSSFVRWQNNIDDGLSHMDKMFAMRRYA